MAGRVAPGAMATPLLPGRKSEICVEIYSPYGKEENLNLPPQSPTSMSRTEHEVNLVMTSSLFINFLLFVSKLYAFIVSGSLAVMASLVDSAIDLLGQGVLMWTNHIASQRALDEDYPVGRTRLEPIGVVICAVVMGMASMEVISRSFKQLVKYWDKPVSNVPVPDMTTFTVLLLVFIILLKAALWYWSNTVHKRHPQNEGIKAIAQDNFNDVVSNLVALLSAEVVLFGRYLWSVDPIAGILISVYITYTWIQTGKEQVEMIVGKRAAPDFLQRIRNFAEAHHPQMQLDHLRAYHFGPKYLVELEVVMPLATTLRESHDAGITLQHKVELLEEVERCFVHIDYTHRENDDHDPGVPIQDKVYSSDSL